jgi:hypothetical protein
MFSMVGFFRAGASWRAGESAMAVVAMSAGKSSSRVFMDPPRAAWAATRDESSDTISRIC